MKYEIQQARFGVPVLNPARKLHVEQLDVGNDKVKMALDTDEQILWVVPEGGRTFAVPVTNIRSLVPIVPNDHFTQSAGAEVVATRRGRAPKASE